MDWSGRIPRTLWSLGWGKVRAGTPLPGMAKGIVWSQSDPMRLRLFQWETNDPHIVICNMIQPSKNADWTETGCSLLTIIWAWVHRNVVVQNIKEPSHKFMEPFRGAKMHGETSPDSKTRETSHGINVTEPLSDTKMTASAINEKFFWHALGRWSQGTKICRKN